MGRSRNPAGPYLDEDGRDLAQGDGTLFLKSNGAQIGPGHFGRLIVNGHEYFSCHYEADRDNEDKSTLDIRPLLWSKDGWPQPGS
jgi:arabinan endo-1,5-alpha-L-arabinosidase